MNLIKIFYYLKFNTYIFYNKYKAIYIINNKKLIVKSIYRNLKLNNFILIKTITFLITK